MGSRTPPAGFYGPETLAALGQAFSATWAAVQSADPFRDYDHSNELRIALSQRLLALAAEGEKDPEQLRRRALEGLPLI